MKKQIVWVCYALFLFTGVQAQNFNYVKKISGRNNDSSRVAGDFFGASVAISGNYAAIAAPSQDYDSLGTTQRNNAGAAFIWERNTSTGVWGRVKKIVPSGTNAWVGNYGNASVVNINGNYLVYGFPNQSYDSTGGNNTVQTGAGFIWERNNAGAWVQTKWLSAPDRRANDYAFNSVAIDSTTVVAGARQADYDSANGNYKASAGCAYVYERRNGVWGFAKKLSPPNTDSARVASDGFGYSVALSGNYMAIGALQQDYDSAGGNIASNAGAVYMYEKVNGEWIYIKKLTPPNINNARVAGDQFGVSVAISGNTLVVGANLHDYDSAGGNLVSNTGAVYVFDRVNGVWGYTKKLTPPNGTGLRDASSFLGVAVSFDGDLIVASSQGQGYDSAGGNYKANAGAAFVFERRNGVWGYAKKLTPPNTDSARVASDAFGSTVAISGNYIIAGCGTSNSQDWDSAGGNYKSNAGAAYFFERSVCTLTYNNGWTGSSPSGSTVSCACTISAGTATIASGAVLNTLTVNSGTTASLSGDLSIKSNYTNNGTVSGVGKIVLDGTSAQNIYGTGTTGNLQLNNSAGATIQDSLGINGVLTLSSGTLTTNNKLKLEATGATTYGQIAGTGTGTLSGNLTAEMLIAGGGADWRPVNSPVSGATLAQVNDDVVLNFGTPDNDFATVYYFNEQTSPYWSIPTGTSAAFGDTAYSIYMGGTSSWANPLPLTLDIQGTYRGTSDYTHANLTRTGSKADTTGWHYIGNPWPSGFTWDDNNITINSGGVQGNQVWLYNQSAGAYQVFDGTDNGVIPPFTPMLIEVTTNNTSITLKNSARTTDSLVNYFDKTSLPNFVQVQVSDKNGKTDKVKFYTDDNATNGYDVMDGNKRPNLVAPNLYFVLEGRKANKEVRNTIENQSAQLSFEAKEAGQYTFSFTTENMTPDITVELADKQSGVKHDITKGDYTFAHDLSNAANRFELRFSKKSGVSVEEVTENKFPVYVGSTGNTITINAPNTANYTVEVMDLLGRTVQAPVSFTGNQIQTLTVNGVSTGYYLVKINGNNVYKTVKVFLR